MFSIRSPLNSKLARLDYLKRLSVHTTSSNYQIESTEQNVEKPKFTKLLRNSDLVRKGFIKSGFVTSGVITNVMNATVFIDYGGKFQLITQKPKLNEKFYVRGAEVLIKVTDWELTARFIGMDSDSTLCESDGRIIRLLKSPLKSDQFDDDSRSPEVTESIDDQLDTYLKKFQSSK